jgi:hypothetical protein
LDINLNTQEISNKTSYRNEKMEWMYRW